MNLDLDTITKRISDINQAIKNFSNQLIVLQGQLTEASYFRRVLAGEINLDGSAVEKTEEVNESESDDGQAEQSSQEKAA